MRKAPAFHKAIACVARRCHAICTKGCSSLLPRATLLAREACVSHQTMWNALHELRRRGLLEIRHGKGFALTGSVEDYRNILRQYDTNRPADTLPAVEPAHTTVAHALQRDIVTGTFRHNTVLPSFKELQHRYHTSYQTLKKALHHCVTTGLLERSSHRYRVPPSPRTSSTIRLCVLKIDDPDRGISFHSISGEFSRELCADAAQRHIDIQITGCGLIGDSPAYFTQVNRLNDLPVDNTIKGYVVIADTAAPALKKLLHRLSRIPKPIAIADFCGEWKDPGHLLQRPDVRVYHAALSKNPGYRVGRFLAQMGHRRIAYLSPFHQAQWSRNRLDGLSDAMALYPSASRPCAFTLPNPPVINRFYEPRVRNECDIDALVRSYQVWKKHNPAYAAESLDSFFNDDLAHRVLPFAYFRSHLRTLFVRAAAHPDITAWVAANDTVAVEAMKYCVHNAISVPQHISLIGFDDSAAALQAGLSSYNFDIPSLSHLILEWILLNRSAPASRPDTRESVSGTVVQRHSTGRV